MRLLQFTALLFITFSSFAQHQGLITFSVCKKVLGNPSNIEYNGLHKNFDSRGFAKAYFGIDVVFFSEDQNGELIFRGYDNISGNLNLSFLGVGKSTNKLCDWLDPFQTVIQVHGLPKAMFPFGFGDKLTMYYGNSKIYIENGLLIGYENRGHLRIKLSSQTQNNSYIKIGSSYDNVINVKGTPDTFYYFVGSTEMGLHYDNVSYILFDKVVTSIE